MHSLWSVQFPLIGLLFGSGLLLIQVGPEDRPNFDGGARGWSGAVVAPISLLMLGLLAFALIEYRAAIRPDGDGQPLLALAEVAGYGFGGGVPAAMQPLNSQQVERGLGSSPRMVTVTMGSTLFAMSTWIVFVLLALVGRAMGDAQKRRRFLLTAPLLIAPALLIASHSRWLYEGLWANERWFVKAYGPVLLLDAIWMVTSTQSRDRGALLRGSLFFGRSARGGRLAGAVDRAAALLGKSPGRESVVSGGIPRNCARFRSVITRSGHVLHPWPS